MSDNILKIGKYIEETAKKLNKNPRDVQKRDLKENTDFTDYLGDKVPGGLTAVKNYLFPVIGKDLKSGSILRNSNANLAKLESALGNSLVQSDAFIEAIKSIPRVSLTGYKASSKSTKKSSGITREVNLVLSDLHIGSDISSEETGGSNFGKTEESRRLARVIKETINYKPQYRANTGLNVCLLGDIVQNNLHDQRDGAPLTEQCCRAIYLLSQSVAQLAANYPVVNVYCTTGNHGRNTGRHKGRAVNQKWDSMETIIYAALKQASSHLKNVHFIIPKTPFVVYSVFGKKVFLTHGDSVLSPGYPGKAVNTGKLEAQVNRFNASLTDKDEYSVVVCGHVHTGSTVHLSNGAVLITNGPLVPADEYAVSIGLLETNCGQYLFESTEGFPVGDMRFVKVSSVDDKDKTLDKIIKPWENL